MIKLGSPPAPSPPCLPCGGSSSRRHGRCRSSGRGGPGDGDDDSGDDDDGDDSDGDDGDGGANLLNEAHLPKRALADHFDRLEVVHAKPTSLQSAGK